MTEALRRLRDTVRSPVRSAHTRSWVRATSVLALALPLVTSGTATATLRVPAAGTSSQGWPLAPAPVVVHPFEPPTARWGAGHRGVDLAAVPGQRLLSPRPAAIAFAGTVAGVPAISLDHPDGTRTTYQPAVTAHEVGSPINQGEAFAVVVPGASHCAPQTCLHWGLRRGKEYLNPLTLVEVVRIRLLPLTR